MEPHTDPAPGHGRRPGDAAALERSAGQRCQRPGPAVGVRDAVLARDPFRLELNAVDHPGRAVSQATRLSLLGGTYHRGIRRRVARLVLRSADVVFVNDDQTAAEVREVAGVEARRLP